MVRSLDELKEELRSLTVRVDGQEETVAGLLEAGRLIFYHIWTAFGTNLTSSFHTCRLFLADYSSLATLPLVPGRVFYAPQVRRQQALTPKAIDCSSGGSGQDFSRKPGVVGNPPLLPALNHPPRHSGLHHLSTFQIKFNFQKVWLSPHTPLILNSGKSAFSQALCKDACRSCIS